MNLRITTHSILLYKIIFLTQQARYCLKPVYVNVLQRLILDMFVLKSQNIYQLHSLGLHAVPLFFATNHQDLDEIDPNVLIPSLFQER